MMSGNRKKIYLSPPHMSGMEMSYIGEAFQTNWVAPLGPHVDAFEQELAASVGTQGAVATSSGTAALHLALLACGVGRGDRVFCSSLTFVASANPIRYIGAIPVFVDSEPCTWNMSPEALLRALGDALRDGRLPKAVVVVHLYGQSARMDEIMAICDLYQVPVIEDAAESLGSTFDSQQTGSIGRFGIYSFNGNKIITTSGGGMLVSNNLEDLKYARFLATQAKDPAPYYEHSTIGYNYRMSNVLAGLGRAQLQVLGDRVARRRAIFARYAEKLRDVPGLSFMPELENTRSNRWLTALTVDERYTGCTAQQIVDALAAEQIEARPVWKPMHQQPIFRGTRYYPHETGVSVSDRLFATGLCLPSGSSMTEEEQDRVIDRVLSICQENSRYMRRRIAPVS